MDDQSLRGWWVILVSFFLAMVLSILSLPGLGSWEFGFLRPDWILLVLIYWVIALPHRVGLLTAWVLGLLADVLLGTLLGQHAIVFMVVAYVASNLYQRLRMFAVWQQSLVVFALVGLAQLIGALVWPWMFLLLRFMRRFFGVT